MDVKVIICFIFEIQHEISTMKILLPILIFFHFSFIGLCQQEPIFSLNETNQGFFNPSATAVHDQYLVNTQYRNQWIGFNGSPVTYLLNYEMDIDKINSGVGLVAMRDEIGLNINHSIGLNYRYTFKLGEFSKLSAGLGLNWYHLRFSNGWVTPESTQDPFLPPTTLSSWNLNSGLHFQHKKLNIGLGFMNINQARANSSQPNSGFSYRKRLHSTLLADYTFELTGNFSLTPSVFIITDWIRLSNLISLKGMHYNRFWWLAGYRFSRQSITSVSTINVGGGVQLWNRLHIGIIYEYSLSHYLSGFNSTLEAYIAFRIKK